MPDLGKKYECFHCHTKFYNLGKPEAICPEVRSQPEEREVGRRAASGAAPAAPLGPSRNDPGREPAGVR